MTHFLKSLMNRNLFALAAFAAVVAPQALKAENAQCPLGNATMNGTYAMSATGTIIGLGPITVVGEVFYDGQGSGNVIAATISVNGAVSKLSSVPASFVVNRDCTGSKTIGTGPSTQHYDFVITPDGYTITWVVTDSGVALMGTAQRLKR
jgi:hypothetical protein